MKETEIYKLASRYLELIEEKGREIPERDEPILWEKMHMASASRIGYILAKKRGIDPLLAAGACMLHDFGRVVTGVHEKHAQAGYEPVKNFLKDMDIFQDKQIEEIALAVREHSNKGKVGTPLEEIVKDADVLDFYQYGFQLQREDQKERLKKLLQEKELF